jgi:major membrane immunogen (membrane-anchored lipoprotein)
MEELLTKFLRTGIYPITAISLLLLLVTPAAADMDGVMMHDGTMMMMKAGHPATAMDHEVTMSDGTVVSVDGTVKSKDGKTFHLQDGEMIMMDGHLMKGGKAAPMSHQEL